MSTSVGSGVAVPHATIEGLEAPVLLDVRLPTSVPWSCGQDVDRCFVIMVPPGHHQDHLQLLRDAVHRIEDEAA